MELAEKAQKYERASLSPNTERTYHSMWKKFEAWCHSHSLSSLPTTAENVAAYISHIGESVSFSYLDSVLAAIEWKHEGSGLTIKGDLSIYRRIRKGIRRTHAGNQTLKQAKPLSVLDLKVVCCQLGNSLTSMRDKALLTTAFFGGFRRSELASLDIDHIAFDEKGAIITLLRSKTSDTKQTIYLAKAKDKDICAVTALKDWMACLEETANHSERALFRSFIKGGKIAGRLSGHGVCEIIKKYFGEEYSGHSTRRGLATAAADAKTPLHILKKLGRWKGADMPLRYAEDSSGFEDSAVNVLGV